MEKVSIENLTRKPSWLMFLTEIFRTVVDIFRGLFFKYSRRFERTVQNSPVLVIPGFLGSDLSTSFLRKHLSDLGYQVYGWGLGRNLADLDNLPILANKIEEIYQKHQQKVTLIGWSLGGVYARELAKQNPVFVEQIITLGSPFRNLEAPNHARWIFDLLGKSTPSPEFLSNVCQCAPLPTTAIYTKQDGVVSWAVCMEDEDELHQNYEVWGSHCGLIYNPQVLQILEHQLKAPHNAPVVQMMRV
ncbi:MAG: esterase/lipase family protein [Runella sp.]